MLKIIELGVTPSSNIQNAVAPLYAVEWDSFDNCCVVEIHFAWSHFDFQMMVMWNSKIANEYEKAAQGCRFLESVLETNSKILYHSCFDMNAVVIRTL